MSDANKIHRGPLELPNPLHVEGFADTAYLPGNVVFKSGDKLTLAAAAATGQLLIAKENGPGVGGHIADAFTVDLPISAYVARPGLVFEVRCVTGQALVENETLLARADNGQIEIAVDPAVPVFVARETVTTSAGNQLVTVEAL